MLKHLLAASLLVGAAGCTVAPTQPSQAPAVADKGADCERTYSTGSNFPKVVCYTPQERKAHQESVEAMQEAIRHAPQPINGGN